MFSCCWLFKLVRRFVFLRISTTLWSVSNSILSHLASRLHHRRRRFFEPISVFVWWAIFVHYTPRTRETLTCLPTVILIALSSDKNRIFIRLSSSSSSSTYVRHFSKIHRFSIRRLNGSNNLLRLMVGRGENAGEHSRCLHLFLLKMICWINLRNLDVQWNGNRRFWQKEWPSMLDLLLLLLLLVSSRCARPVNNGSSKQKIKCTTFSIIILIVPSRLFFFLLIRTNSFFLIHLSDSFLLLLRTSWSMFGMISQRAYRVGVDLKVKRVEKKKKIIDAVKLN